MERKAKKKGNKKRNSVKEIDVLNFDVDCNKVSKKNKIELLQQQRKQKRKKKKIPEEKEKKSNKPKKNL